MSLADCTGTDAMHILPGQYLLTICSALGGGLLARAGAAWRKDRGAGDAIVKPSVRRRALVMSLRSAEAAESVLEYFNDGRKKREGGQGTVEEIS